MKKSLLLIVLLCIGFLSCCSRPQIITEPVYSYVPPKENVSYTRRIKPILEKRCVVCHSCYNSPCQLKFSSWEGLDLGASKERIYNADRLQTMEPSRLFVDARNTDEWRKKGFYSVKPERESDKFDESIMFMLLDHKRRNPSLLDSCREDVHFNAEAKDLACPESTAEVNDFLKKHPNRGMPFGFPPLSQEEFNLVVGWLSQGAKGPEDDELDALKAIAEEDQEWVARWENFLNTKEPRHRLTARYLYEHLFLAHINFRADSGHFYELVRSKSPPEEPIDIVATRRPYDDPGTPWFTYRFRKIHSLLVHKTHMVFTMDERQFDLVRKLFIETPWEPEPGGMSYDEVTSANPFETFRKIPVRSRYEWLLDNAHYIIMSFIRGPVCKGQVALNVINDHFWLFFMDPEYDVTVKDPAFLEQYAQKLRMPAEKGSNLKLLWAKFSFKRKYKPWVEEYYKARQKKYEEMYQKTGLGPEAIWVDPRVGNGGEGQLAERDQQQSLLTVFRHFDSASVHRGALGKIPKTVWVVDYPILERIYYSLVAGFDVYGTKAHQGATRKYMDSLRIEAESSFLEFMPPASREPMMKSWYQNLLNEDDLVYVPTDNPSGFPFRLSGEKTTEANANESFKTEFLKYFVERMNLQLDPNFLAQEEVDLPLPDTYESFTDVVRGFQAVARKEDSFIKRVADHNANVAWVKVVSDQEKSFFSVLVDRWHHNVAYMKDEDLMLDRSRDTVDVLPGLVGSYPNYFFVVKKGEIAAFLKVLYEYNGTKRDTCRLETFGINRGEPQFWEVYDEFQEAFDKQHKERAGIIDLNRYYSFAMQKMLFKGGTEYECEAIADQLEKDRRWWQ